MPFAIPAIIAGIAAFGGSLATGATIFGLSTLTSAIIIGVGTAVLQIGATLLQQSLAKNPAALQDFSAQSRALTQTVRLSAQPWKIVYGETRVGGVIVFASSSDSLTGPHAGAGASSGGTAANKYLHLVVVLAKGPVEKIGTVFFDDYPIYDEDLDSDGWMVDGAEYRYRRQIRVRKYLGANDQEADPDLIADCGAQWTSAHRGRGHAYLYVTLAYDGSTFGGGIPNITAVVKGKRTEDVRVAGSPTAFAWSPNPVLAVRGFLTTAYAAGGVGARAPDMNDAENASEANICDEFVATQAVTMDVRTVSAAGNTLDLDGEINLFQSGDRVHVEAVDSPAVIPSGLAGSPNVYYVIITKERKRVEKEGATPTHWPQIKLAATYADALAETAIDLADAGQATLRIVKDGEPRYTCNYAFETKGRGWRQKALADMLSSMGGYAVNVGGIWRILAAAWRPPTITFDENDLRAGIATPTKITRRERFNAVQGKYADPVNLWTADSYPSFTSAAFEAEDVLGRKFGLLDLPATSRAQTARRLAKIFLYRHRKQFQATLPLKLTGMQVQAGETFMLDNAVRGLMGFQMEAVEWTLKSEGEPPALVVDIDGRETGSDIHDWDHTTEEQAVAARARPNLPDAFNPGLPGVPNVTEATYEGRSGSDVQTIVTMSWASGADAFIVDYELQYAPTGAADDDDFLPFGPGTVPHGTLTADHLNLDPGSYDFRVRARNILGATSAWSTTTKEILGLSADPTAITGLGLQKLGGQALLKWDLHPDADVRRGGWVEFRHSPAQNASDADATTSIGSEDGRVPGRDTVASLPLKAGTYFARAIDKLGNTGPWATVSTDGAEQLAFSTTGSIVEDAAFPGTHFGTLISGAGIKLDGGDNIDDWGNVDDITDWDSGGNVADSGYYVFSAYLDSGNTSPKRLRGHIAASVFSVADTIDGRTANIDTWESLDGATSPGAADAWIEYRETDTDPALSPSGTWSEWSRLDVTQSAKRYFEFRCQLRSYDPSFNILVTELRAYAEAVV